MLGSTFGEYFVHVYARQQAFGLSNKIEQTVVSNLRICLTGTKPEPEPDPEVRKGPTSWA